MGNLRTARARVHLRPLGPRDHGIDRDRHPDDRRRRLGLTLAGVFERGVITPETLPSAQYDITPLAGAFVDGLGQIEPLTFVLVVFTFFFVDFFDTAGTLIGVSQFGDFLDEDGDLPDMDKPLMADAVGRPPARCSAPLR